MSKLEAEGAVYVVNDTQTRGTFTFRTFVLEVDRDSRYPQLVEFQTTRDNIEKLDELGVGDLVRVTFNLRGREWRSQKGEIKFFNTLDAWKIDVLSAAQRQSGGGGQVQGGPDDDIPF